MHYGLISLEVDEDGHRKRTFSSEEERLGMTIWRRITHRNSAHYGTRPCHRHIFEAGPLTGSLHVSLEAKSPAARAGTARHMELPPVGERMGRAGVIHQVA